MKKLTQLFLLSTLLFVVLGCGTTTLQTKVKMTKSVFLDPSYKGSLFIDIKNISGEKIDLLPTLKKNLLLKGYVATNDANIADRILQITILFANNLKEANALKAAGVTGATTGLIAAGSGASGADSIITGAIFAIAAGAISKSMEDETYRAVVDIQIIENHTDTTHKSRILAQAVKTDLDLNEALPILEKDIATQISNIF